MAPFANAPSEEVTRQYLEAFASAMTIEQAERFVEVTKDKHFEVTGTRDDGQPMVELTEGPLRLIPPAPSLAANAGERE